MEAANPNRLRSTRSRVLLALGCLLTAGAVVTMMIAAAPGSPSHKTPPARASASAAEPSSADRHGILDRNPVDAGAAQPVPMPVPAEPSEKSQLPLNVVVVRDDRPIGELAPAVPPDPPLEDRLAHFEQAMLDVANGEARVLPELEGDQLVGLHVSAIQEGSRFAEVGFEEDDVITQFNGVSLDSPFLALHAVREMLETDGYHVLVRRGDAMTPLQWDGAGR